MEIKGIFFCVLVIMTMAIWIEIDTSRIANDIKVIRTTITQQAMEVKK